jgi:hypothetical protein
MSCSDERSCRLIRIYNCQNILRGQGLDNLLSDAEFEEKIAIV